MLSTFYQTIWTYTVIEWPKVLQKNGYYLVFGPLVGMLGFHQAVLRTTSILGPYSLGVVFTKGTSPYGGARPGLLRRAAKWRGVAFPLRLPEPLGAGSLTCSPRGGTPTAGPRSA